MAGKIQKTLWVTGVQPVEVNGSRYIPTALLYEKDGTVTFGKDATQALSRITNNNFKIDLGDISPGSSTRKLFPTEHGGDKSAYELSKDFFELSLSAIEKELAVEESHKIPAKIIVAEPLNFQLQENYKTWVQNYRGNIRRILSKYEEVEFLPEPFAVYQYYRYGQRIPHLQEKAKHIALVLDFGGGTFDACIIESTNQGDISLSGKHSKPLGADSSPIGGFFINQCLAEYLIKRNIDPRLKADADNCIKNHQRIKSGELDISSLSDKKQIFLKNFRTLISACEQYKIDLASCINTWGLSNDAYERVPIMVPRDPFIEAPWIQDELFAHQLRKLFIEKIWNEHLHKVIKKVFKLAENELTGKDITITLISGGSSNIRWMLELLKRDFENELAGAEPIPISQSFQEVVATGLAIECARRFYEGESEFVGVTYNPIRLKLEPDNKGFDLSKPFISVGDKVDMKEARPGDLVPSALALNNFIDEPLQWRIKLSSPPKTQLRYIFSKPAEAGEEDIYNAESQVVHTRENKQFDSAITVQLVVSRDGTAKPSFIYKTPNPSYGVTGNIVAGTAFAIDMTTPTDSKGSSVNYIGYDFGTCSSAICLITQDQVKTTKTRAEKTSWLELSDALSRLPYPVAYPLRKYLDVKTSHHSTAVAREVFEAGLAFLAYTAASEALTFNPTKHFFKNFQHRSMGPLKDLLIRSLELGKKNLKFCSALSALIPKHLEQLEKSVQDFTKHKHEKLDDESFDSHGHLYLIVNLCLEIMKGRKFGYVADSRPMPFNPGTSIGLFKVASDIQPFIESIKFKSSIHLPREIPLILDLETGNALPLFPLLFWSEDSEINSGFECYWFDKPAEKGDSSGFVKPCSRKNEIPANEINSHLSNAINQALEQGNPPFGILDFIIDEPEE
jgi:molecular chaperone DnaK (HSP70)